jgi:hypothetical protein
MDSFSNRDIDILTAIIVNEKIFIKSSSINSINKSCDVFNRTGYHEDLIKKSLDKLISLKIVKSSRKKYKVAKDYRKLVKREFRLTTDYFKIYTQLSAIFKNS